MAKTYYCSFCGEPLTEMERAEVRRRAAEIAAEDVQESASRMREKIVASGGG